MESRSATQSASSSSTNPINPRSSSMQTLPSPGVSVITSYRERGNQQQSEVTTSSNSSRGRKNQQQPEETASSISSRGRRNQQQPEEAASSISARRRRNEQQPEEAASSTSTRRRRNEQQPESAANSFNARGSRNQQQPEDTVSINTRGRRRERQRIVDYSSNLSGIYEPEDSDEADGLYDENFVSLPEVAVGADNENLYIIDSRGIYVNHQSHLSQWLKSFRLVYILCTLVSSAALIFPVPLSELIGIRKTFRLQHDSYFLIMYFVQSLLFLFLHLLEIFQVRYDDSMLIFIITFIFRISRELKYRMTTLDNDYENQFVNVDKIVIRDFSYFLILQALLMWINKVLPVVNENVEHFVLNSISHNMWFLAFTFIGIIQYYLCQGDITFPFSILCTIIIDPLRMGYMMQGLLLGMYFSVMYYLIKRFRFRDTQELTPETDHEVYFHSLSRFDKFVTLFIIILPFILLLDRNYIPVSQTIFHLNQEDMNDHVEKAKTEFEDIQKLEDAMKNRIFEGNNLLTILSQEMPVSHISNDPASLENWLHEINTYHQRLEEWIELLESLDISNIMFDKEKVGARIEFWIRQLRELKTGIEDWLQVLLQHLR